MGYSRKKPFGSTFEKSPADNDNRLQMSAIPIQKYKVFISRFIMGPTPSPVFLRTFYRKSADEGNTLSSSCLRARSTVIDHLLIGKGAPEKIERRADGDIDLSMARLIELFQIIKGANAAGIHARNRRVFRH